MSGMESLMGDRYRRLVRRLCGSEFAMQERNWREVLKVNAQFAEAHKEALHHLDCVELEPSDDNTDWERIEAAKAALKGRNQVAAAGDDGVFV